MIKNELSSVNTKIHACKVEKVFASGMINARSERDGSFFDHVNVTFLNSEGLYQIGDRCLVVSDGAQHYAIGQLRDPARNSSGNTTIRSLTDDLADLADSKSLVSTDEFGNQSRVVVSKGGGVIVDGGEMSISHWNPGLSKISHFSEKSEIITVPYTFEAEHDGIQCEVNYRFRTLVDKPAVDRDFEYDPQPSLEKGNTLEVNINPNDMLIAKTRGPFGVSQAEIQVDTQGNVSVKTDTGSVDVSTTLGSVTTSAPAGNVTIETTVGAVQVKTDGTVYIGNSAISLRTIIDTILTTLSTSQTATILGPMPLLPWPASAEIYKNTLVAPVLSQTKAT